MLNDRLPTVVLCLGALLGLAACSSAESKFCPKMKQLYGEGMNDCETDALPEIKAECKEPEAVFQCVADAADKEAADKCQEKCVKK
jgi:hypothetical protein